MSPKLTWHTSAEAAEAVIAGWLPPTTADGLLHPSEPELTFLVRPSGSLRIEKISPLIEKSYAKSPCWIGKSWIIMVNNVRIGHVESCSMVMLNDQRLLVATKGTAILKYPKFVIHLFILTLDPYHEWLVCPDCWVLPGMISAVLAEAQSSNGVDQRYPTCQGYKMCITAV